MTEVALAAEPASPTRAVGWVELLLGTRVEISCRADSLAAGQEAVRSAFEQVRQVHHLMSFHERNSDVSQLNRLAAIQPVRVDPRTVAVLRAACELSRLTAGRFDITTAAELVRAGRLPRPASGETPVPGTSWRDIDIVSEDTVSFRRPLWLDLGGIAKGYAVDQAFRRCLGGQVTACLVNAGGDLRVSDGLTASISLVAPRAAAEPATIELSDGSLASSCGWPAKPSAPHYDGSTRSPVDPERFVSVLARNCMDADALTKVVLIDGEKAALTLARYGATAFLHDGETGWIQVPHKKGRNHNG